MIEKFIELFSIEVSTNNTLEITYLAGLSGDNVQLHYLTESELEDKYFKKGWILKVLYIWDDRNFNEEEISSKWSITNQLIDSLDMSNELISFTSTPSTGISVQDLELKIEEKFQEKTDEIGRNISDNFKKYYREDFDEVRLKSNYSWINNSNFKITSEIKNPITWTFIKIGNLWAGLRSIYILSLLKTFNNLNDLQHTIFLIEEPELYLHPELQKEISWTLKDISEHNMVFFTTHSPLLLNQLDINNVRNIYFDTTINTTVITNTNMDILCKDLWYNPIDILNKKLILFVEWTSDISVFSQIIEKFYNWIINQVKIISIWWCSNLPQYATLNFIWESPILIDNSLIIIDRDYQPVSSTPNADTDRVDNFKAWLKKIIDPVIVNNYDDGIIHITPWHSLENLFLDFSIINRIFPWINLDEAMLRSEFRGFANWSWYFNSNTFRRHFNKMDSIPDFFDHIEDRTLALNNIRGHNIMHYLIFKCYWEDYANITSENELDFCNRYIQESSYNSFLELLMFLNKKELFEQNKVF